MRCKNILILFFCIALASCSSSRKVTTKPKNEEKKEVVEEKKEKVPSVHSNKHIKKLEKSGKSLNKDRLNYIKKYSGIAVVEMHKYKIPASITLAQGILESGSGKSTLARKSNNHFGIKCHKGWNGGRVYHDDDEKGECFRKYKYVESSYKDHSEFLTKRRRYADLFTLRITDYKGWAKGLKRAGYATDPKYPKKLINIIEDYELYAFDKYSKKDAKQLNKTIPKEEVIVQETIPSGVEKVGGKTYYTVAKGDTLYSIAKRFKSSVPRLKKINKLRDNNLSIGQKLFIR